MKYRSISVRQDLWRELKGFAGKRGISLNDYLEELLDDRKLRPDTLEGQDPPDPMGAILEGLDEVAAKVAPVEPVKYETSARTIEHSPTCSCAMCR